MKITEKVSPMHPDKIADRIAGTLVDYCYKKEENPKCAFEVLIGHSCCYITGETSVSIPEKFVKETAERICKEELKDFKYVEVAQDSILSSNHNEEIRCGDNGVFAGFVMPDIHKKSLDICRNIYNEFETDGKIVINDDTKELTICWSNAENQQILDIEPNATNINPLGFWTGGINVDTGITGRKLASDFYGIQKPLGGGTMHGKDLSKADCSVNIYCFLKAKEKNQEQIAICSIGDSSVNINGELVKFSDIMKEARDYIKKLGGFEKLAEWGLQ